MDEIVNYHEAILEACAPIDDSPRNGVGASKQDVYGWDGDSLWGGVCQAQPQHVLRLLEGGVELAFSFLSLAVAERAYV